MKSQFLSLDLDTPAPIAVIVAPPLKMRGPLSPLERRIAEQIAPPRGNGVQRAYYPPGIGPEFESLIMAIGEVRGWGARHTLEMALIRLASPDEAEIAGLLE
jgi:hypothetical protein